MNNFSVWPWVEPAHDFAGARPPDKAWPKISIVTPNFNYGHLIEATIRSVLMQNYPNLEYIVIDDGSTDNSVELIKKYEPKLGYFERHENQGQYSTINKGFSKATGEIFGWLNSDDTYFPWTLHIVGKVFAEFPEVDWIIGNPSTIQDGVVHYLHPLKPFPRAMIRAGLFHEGEGGFGYIQQESCFWRRTLWDKAGGLRVGLRYVADYELWTRFAKFAELYSVSTLLGGFTDRGSGNRSVANKNEYVAEVKKVIAEIRADGSSPEAKLARRLAMVLTLAKGSLYMTSIVKRMPLLRKLQGPVLHWDFRDPIYGLTQRSFF